MKQNILQMKAAEPGGQQATGGQARILPFRRDEAAQQRALPSEKGSLVALVDGLIVDEFARPQGKLVDLLNDTDTAEHQGSGKGNAHV